jgi:alanine racemase
MSLFSRLRAWRKQFSRYEPLISVRISRSRLLHNLRVFQKACLEQRIAPVLKSNAYGHGLVEVARTLDHEDIAFFALDSLHEAITLRAAGIRSPIVIIGYTPVSNMLHARVRGVAFTVTSLSQLAEVVGAGAAFCIHLKLDTGMHRQGILESEWAEAQTLLRSQPRIVLEGICSHFADADTADSPLTTAQRAVWERAVSAWGTYDTRIRFFHIAATAGSHVASETSGNVVRLGLGLYGIDAYPREKYPLKPVLSLETLISSIKRIQTGDPIGYNATLTAPKPMTIATIPAGYFEGIDRRLSNTGVVTVRGIPCPIVGRVSMNITTIDVSHIPNVARNEHVIVLSNETTDPNSVEESARIAGTIPWEILVHIPQHLRRTIVD